MCKILPHIRILGVAGGKSSVAETDFSWTNTYGRTHIYIASLLRRGIRAPQNKESRSNWTGNWIGKWIGNWISPAIGWAKRYAFTGM